MEKFMSGKVYLVGAGPGDVRLLTLGALEAIEKADVVVFDRLVSRDIMDLVPTNCQLIDVGKNVGDHPVPQWRINEILLEEGQKGKTVVRLKGGDPFVFGRGGEELELLAENGVDFQVIPGITSSIAAASYGGIPVTHRDFTSSFHIITGHGKKDSQVDIDFESLVKLNGTLVFMMSVGRSGFIAEGLIKAGMDKEMPAAIVENGTRLNQRSFVTDLGHLKETIEKEGVVSPAVLIVGKVASLGEKFNWFEHLPLFGSKVLVTQPVKKASKLRSQLEEAGASVTLAPAIETIPLENLDPPVNKGNWLVFTSAAGVDVFFDNLMESGVDVRWLQGKKIAAVGPTTKAALKRRGIMADYMPEEYTGEGLASGLVKLVDKGDTVVFLRAQLGDQKPIDIIKSAGINVIDYHLYNTVLLDQNHLKPEDFHMITFTSASCIRGFLASNSIEKWKNIPAVAIGKITAKACEEAGFVNVYVAKEATTASMVEVAGEVFSQSQRR